MKKVAMILAILLVVCIPLQAHATVRASQISPMFTTPKPMHPNRLVELLKTKLPTRPTITVVPQDMQEQLKPI